MLNCFVVVELSHSRLLCVCVSCVVAVLNYCVVLRCCSVHVLNYFVIVLGLFPVWFEFRQNLYAIAELGPQAHKSNTTISGYKVKESPTY